MIKGGPAAFRKVKARAKDRNWGARVKRVGIEVSKGMVEGAIGIVGLKAGGSAGRHLAQTTARRVMDPGFKARSDAARKAALKRRRNSRGQFA